MPGKRYAEDFKDWIDAYKATGKTVEQNGRIYTLNDEIVIVMFSVRVHKKGSLLISTDEHNKYDLKVAAKKAKEEKKKFFCCGIFDKNATNYVLMKDYILSIEAFDYFLKDGQGTLGLTNFYNEKLSKNTDNIVRIENNGTSVAAIKKTAFLDYLTYFDNRPYMTEGGYKADMIEYRNSKWLSEVSFKDINFPANMLVYGAPGTGKSKMIQDYINSNGIDDNQYERVTFYEDYTYGQFVGAYKPVMNETQKTISGEVDTKSFSGDIIGTQVIYKFVPGPFSRVLLKAYTEILKKNDPINNYYLLIEEINRAKAASVFGNMFQLLDRNKGESIYTVNPSEEFLEWFNNSLFDELGVEQNLRSIKLPPNMFIWATMNSADQGVFPIDSAFKRRWSYVYKDIKSKSNKVIRLKENIEEGKEYNDFDWDIFRNGINKHILLCFDEDRGIGPGYFSDEEFSDIKRYFTELEQGNEVSELNNPLVDKLFSYLKQDVFRNNPTEMFHEPYFTMSSIREAIVNGKKVTDIIKLSANDFVVAKIEDDSEQEENEKEENEKEENEKEEISNFGE